MTAIVPVFLLLLNSLNPSADSCVYNSFLGSYGAYSVFRPDLSCLQSFGTFPSSSVIPCAHREAHRLVWVQQQAVEESSVNSTKHGLDDFLARLSQSKLGTHREDESQAVFSDRDPQGTHWETIHRTSTSLLLSIPSNVALNVDTLLPPFYKSFILPSAPTEYRPIPTPAVDHIKRLLQNLTFNPEVASIVSNISIDQMHNDIRWLTGEDARSPIDSRHSFTSGSRLASEWLKDRFEQTGATCKLEPFSEGFAPNVIWSALFLLLSRFWAPPLSHRASPLQQLSWIALPILDGHSWLALRLARQFWLHSRPWCRRRWLRRHRAARHRTRHQAP
jgi:hypothetical protein